MINFDEVLLIHQTLIDRFGGSPGLRDEGALKSALQRPFQTFDSKPVYHSIVEQASALIESLLINHPFVDGNKRIGYVLLRNFLLTNSLDIVATEDEKYDFIVSVAMGQMKFPDISMWLARHSIENNGV